MTLSEEIHALVDGREAELKARIADLERTISEADQRIAGLESEVSGFALTVAERDAAIGRLTAERDAAAAELALARDGLFVAQAQRTADLARIDQLEARVRELVAAQTADPANLPYWGPPAWRDEFSTGAIDPAKWKILTGDLTVDQNELKASAVTVQDGKARLRGTWKSPIITGRGKYGMLTHDSGYITHGHGFAQGYKQKYGRWEARIKVPTGLNTRGTLAAFWLRNDKGGEWDIFEAWGGGGPMAADWTTYTKDSAAMTVHSDTNQNTVNGKAYRKAAWRYHQLGVTRDLSSRWVTTALEYTPTYAALIVDGVERRRITPTTAGSNAHASIAQQSTLAWLWDPDFFDSPWHVRMNLHIGMNPQYWGNPDPNNRQWTQDPLDYEIEHVRIWAMPTA